MKKQTIDRLSSLPNEIILHILSFLDVKKAATTSVLSKRWQFLWIDLAALKFSNPPWEIEKTRDFVSWLNRTLILRRESISLDTFIVEFLYEEDYFSDVNVWVRFAVRNKVKKLGLLLDSHENDYTLPQLLFSHSSLACLHLQHCTLTPRSKIGWPCLTELRLKLLDVSEDLLGEIQLGCPMLHKLALLGCRGFERLDLDSKSVHELELKFGENFESNQDLFEISAPFVRSFKAAFSPVSLKLRLVMSTQSLVAADICYTVFGYTENERVTTVHIFEKTRHVKDFKVDSHFIYVLTSLVSDGNWRVPRFCWKSLTVENAWRDETVVEGIRILLESSPNLETLLVECLNPYELKVKKGDPGWRKRGLVAKDNLDCNLPHLKTVRLLDFADPILAWEPMLTMAQILLKRATSLETMEINAKGNLRRFRSRFDKMSNTVLSYPRSSEKAVVLIRK